MFKLIFFFIVAFVIYSKNFISQTLAIDYLKSHEATYSLKLYNVMRTSAIHSASGIMNINIKEVCDGWVFNQHTKLTVTDRMGNQNENEFRYSTWESLDHKKFRFISIFNTDGITTSHTEGYAYLNDYYGEIIYQYPKQESIKIAAETLFPINHFLKIMNTDFNNNILTGDLVFSGEDINSLNLVTTFKKELQNKLIKIRSAYFSLSDTSEWPESELELILHKDGLVEKVKFDYTNYGIKGVLLKHKYLKKPEC